MAKPAPEEEGATLSDEELEEVSGGHHGGSHSPRPRTSRPASGGQSFDSWHNLPDGSGSGFGE